MRTQRRIASLLGRLPRLLLPLVLFSLLVASGTSAQAAADTPLRFLGNKNVVPVVYLDDGVAAGVAVDIVRAMAKHLPQPVQIEAMDWAEAQRLVSDGKADALIQINETEQRRKIYDFSEPLLQSRFSIFTSSDRVGVSGVSSLRGLRVGVESGGLPQQVLAQDSLISLTVIPNFLSGFRQLSEGSVDAIAVDYRVGSYVIATNNLRSIKVSGDSIAFSYSAIAVRKGNSELLAAINKALRAIKADGSYDAVLDKWRPKEVVFQTREQISRDTYYAVTTTLLLLLLVSATWMIFLRRELTRRHKSEERLHALVQTIPDLVWLKDMEGVYLFCNPQFERLYGASEAEIIGKTDYDFVSRELADFFRDNDRQAMAAGGPRSNEEWLTFARDGYRGLFETIKTPMLDHTQQVIGVLGIARDVTARKAAEEKIERLAFYDPLTELPNRRLVLDRLRQAIAGSMRDGRQGALLFIDLDNFKVLNDTSGHAVGDLLLIEVSRRLALCVRGNDTIARLGGDEFVVMLEDLSANPGEAAAQAKGVGEKIHAALDRPYAIGDVPHRTTASIGITLFGDGEQSVEDVLKQADIAMYQAKAAGRDTLRFFDIVMETAVAARAAMETVLRSALTNRQLMLHYQPQVNGARGTIGAEALLRWQHPRRGVVMPGEFVPLAEETGLIISIGQWVLETACTQLAAWANDAATAHLQLAINVSARQFRQPNFVDCVRTALGQTGAPPWRLELELTESVVLDNIDDTIAKMQQLKEIGVAFAMDDFGTGYSSLSYLTRLPLDRLKIDQSFICNLPDSESDGIVVQAIITMAHTLGLKVVAEGVETTEQHDFLGQQGCTIFQGYLFGKPMPLGEFEAAVAAR
jgi:diguanylate cyclase (GGDEF)-like protein/PAS domain S-box-containing protein